MDPVQLPTRRFINLVLGWLKEGADEKKVKEIDHQIDLAAKTPHPLVRQQIVTLVKTETGEVKPYKKWRAPKNWKPPGWKSDAEAYHTAKQAMGFVNNPK